MHYFSMKTENVIVQNIFQELWFKFPKATNYRTNAEGFYVILTFLSFLIFSSYIVK